jgi:DNA-binding transcriptional regulator LsrR (DeoR family)
MLKISLAHEPDHALIVRAAWLYYVAGFNQEETAWRLGLHRTRVNRLLGEARERGLVSITIEHTAARDFEIEDAIARRYGLDICVATPAIGFNDPDVPLEVASAQALIARRSVGSAAASILRGRLLEGPMTIGVGWGRTMEQVAQQLSGVRNPAARFVSLMGSLARNSASNPFEVVQAFAARTGGEGHFLPVPFIADTAEDHDTLISQRSVAGPLALAQSADLYLISVGELSDMSFLRSYGMLSDRDLKSLHTSGAVCDTLGKFFDRAGALVDHELNLRTLAIDPLSLRGKDVILLGAGMQKVGAIDSLLRSQIVRGLIIDGDTARLLVGLKERAA